MTERPRATSRKILLCVREDVSVSVYYILQGELSVSECNETVCVCVLTLTNKRI